MRLVVKNGSNMWSRSSGEDLRRALDAALAGETVADQLPSMGCNIKWADGQAPEYFNPQGVS